MYVHTHRDRCCDWGHIKDIVLLFMFYVYAFPCGWLPRGNSIFSWASAAHHHFNMAVVDLVGRHSNLTPPQQPCQITPSPFISPHIYIYFFFFGSPAAAALRISNRFLCFFLRKNHVALIKYCWQVSFGRSLFCFWPGLCIEMSFWFYTREFAVNCYQLRIKFYNIHVSLAIRFFMISFRSSDSDWYCGIYPGFFFY